MSQETVELSKTTWIASFRLNKGHNIKPSVHCPPTRAIFKKKPGWGQSGWHVVKEDGTVLEKSYKDYNIVNFKTRKQAEEFYNDQVRIAIEIKENHIKKMEKSLETFKQRYLP